MGRGEDADVKSKKKNLTSQQRLFMRALHEAIVSSKAPVSVDQIQVQLNKSDSRVRSTIKILMRKGYVRYIGKAKVKKYVPSMLWLEEVDNDESFDEMDLPCVGGYCSTVGCSNMAEDYWRDGYYCRTCMMGHDDASDIRDIRERFLLTISPQSSAGQMLEQVWPTYSEDMLKEDEPKVVPAKTKSRSRRKRSGKTSGSRGSKRSEKESAKS